MEQHRKQGICIQIALGSDQARDSIWKKGIDFAIFYQFFYFICETAADKKNYFNRLTWEVEGSGNTVYIVE